MSPRSLPTEAEIEAEAERERDRSRREAERILTQEAEERRLVEEKVLAMMQSTRGSSPKSLPQPPRPQTASNPPSPATSHKEPTGPSWWIAAKNRLTPTKEPLTPAQQIVQETKARDKEKKKDKDKEWPASSQAKYNDPAFLNIKIPAAPPQRRPVPGSPSSPTPSRPSPGSLPPPLTPSPMRSNDSPSASPSREAPPLYAQFNAQGTLDVPGTLLAITRRFEKLEKWTVTHVRALEDRMNDVERWLVEKEKTREKESESASDPGHGSANEDIHEIREEIVELQGRVGELGREMAKLATLPANLSSGPSRGSAQVSTAPSTPSSQAARSATIPVSQTPSTPRPLPSTVRESTSPPMSSSSGSRGSRTRLPYPSGDYAITDGGRTSPSNSPPASTHHASSISGLPSAGLGAPPSPSPGVLTQASPTARPANLVSPPVRKPLTQVSPTPRKRYTVALGGPITAPPDLSDQGLEMRPSTPPSSRQTSSGGRNDDGDGSLGTDEFQDETIGKAMATRFSQAANGKSPNAAPRSADSPQSSPPRMRAQSTYGLPSVRSQSLASLAPTAPLALRARSHSTDRVGLGITDVGATNIMTPAGSRFVDPLVLRRQEKESKVAMPIPSRGKKVQVGELVAFFDGEAR
jgi:hypothetical protein